MSKWYWKDGTLAVDMDSPDWSEKMALLDKKLRDMSYKVVKQDELPNGMFVSTVWLGLDHSFSGQKPLIFETMVFPKRGNWMDVDCARYGSEDDALKGHEKMVKKYQNVEKGTHDWL